MQMLKKNDNPGSMTKSIRRKRTTKSPPKRIKTLVPEKIVTLPKKEYTVIKSYFLRSLGATRRVKRVGEFLKGKWVQVPANVYRDLSNADGWEGKIEKEEIEV